ncbi:Serine/threonine-protein phosphatase 7 long form-like [Vitis vinifera]|uniref:Serine/threonine-protein phosphatase 7 long form-like n=1 Tax=Vitis vinifera TaxID=29760 RepID=A0A438HDP9_VITVI|nr:Serine/threonine-protein phosphatase 7 long form-like [Vitis vinifera]
MDEIELYIEQVSVQPWERGQFLGNLTQLLLGQNDNVEEFEYDCGPSSAPVAMTYECRANENEEECESQEGDDQSERAEDVQHDGDGVEQGRYVSVDGECCDMSNNPDPDDPIEYSPIHYHSTPSLQFENVENIGTTSFVINKYNGPHKCVNPCLNRDHQQLDSNLIAAHIQGMIKAQFTLSVAAIQPSIERFKHCRPLFSIDGTHLYGKYKDTLMIAMDCDGNNQLFPLAFAITEDRHLGIMAAMSDVHLGWSEPYAYHRVLHNNGWKQSLLKNGHSHDGGRRYGIMSTNMSEVFNSVLKGAHSYPFMREWEMDPRLRPYIIQFGFYGVYRIGHITLDWGLITSLIERWRLETHTFHLPIGEMTITLQDVAVILGLRIHGLLIIGTCDIDWSLLCYELLGFSHPPVDLDDATLEQYARAFILGLIGSTLFTDKKVLAHLYRELCQASLDGATDIAGCVTLLQVLWEPYMGDLVAHLVAISLVDQEIWRTMSPLICFDIVKWHRLERVLRQFGLQQGIPPSCSIEQHLHSVDRRGRHKYDWEAFHAQYITLWASRAERIVTAPPMVGAMQFHDPIYGVVPTYYTTFDYTPSP